MREIEFRGKTVDGSGWVYGSYDNNWKGIGKHYIYSTIGRKIECFQVIPETIGQFTGVVDRGGKRIYENDEVEIDKELANLFDIEQRGIIQYHMGSFFVGHGQHSDVYRITDAGGQFRGLVINNVK